MKIGASLPLTWLGDLGLVRETSQAAEQAGFDYMSMGGHILTAEAERYPHMPARTYASPYRNPFVLFSHLAASTKRLEFRSAIMILPLFPTALVAREAADLADLSDGRFELGVAISWQAAEYEALGQEFAVRAARMEEQIEVLRLLWSEPRLSYRGRFHAIDGLGLGKLPDHQIPILIGCGHDERPLRRVARLADGWLAVGAELDEPIGRLRRYLEEAGRSPEAVKVATMLRLEGGDPDSWRRDAQALETAGVSEIALAPPPDGPPSAALAILLEAHEALL
jgi:probable F420-dependent oxidoreductase